MTTPPLRAFAPALALCAALCGCGPASGALREMAQAQASEMAYVLPPGMPIDAGGAPAAIFGFDPCPAASPAMRALFGPSPGEGSSSCVDIRPGDASARVALATRSGSIVETWRVERPAEHPGAIALRRPDGSLAAAFGSSSQGEASPRAAREPQKARAALFIDNKY